MNMEKTKNTICAPPMNAAASPMARILSDVRWLMSQPRGSLVWMGTQRDLVEMVNIAWMQRAVIDSQGRPCTRKAMADRIFSVVGRVVAHQGRGRRHCPARRRYGAPHVRLREGPRRLRPAHLGAHRRARASLASRELHRATQKQAHGSLSRAPAVTIPPR